jgi:CRISPR-associated endonuclease/helicase Cas3
MSNDESKNILQAILNLNYEEVGHFCLIEERDKVDIFVEIDKEASQIWRRFVELQEIEDFHERRRIFNDLKADFYQYVISILSKRAAENLPPEVAGMRFISRSQIEEFYNLETGFIEKGDYSVW